MFDVFDTVDMSVHIHIIIMCIDRPHQLGFIVHLYSRTLFYRAFLFGIYIVYDFPIMYLQYILGLTGLCTYHRPHTATIPVYLTVFSFYLKVTVSEISHSSLYSYFHKKLGILTGHVGQFQSQTRQHPRFVYRIQIRHTESARIRVKVGCIEHIVTQMTEQEMVGKITMERFCHKGIPSYLTRFYHFSIRSTMLFFA